MLFDFNLIAPPSASKVIFASLLLGPLALSSISFASSLIFPLLALIIISPFFELIEKPISVLDNNSEHSILKAPGAQAVVQPFLGPSLVTSLNYDPQMLSTKHLQFKFRRKE